MRNQLKIVYGALTVVAALGLTGTVHGVPAFARQTGLDCNSCHTAHGFPSLNTFGQAFKAGGFTQANEDSLMGDGEGLSLPKTLNLAVVGKMRYVGTSSTAKDATDATKVGKATTGSEVNLPDEWAIWLAGRVSKHIGFATEYGSATDNKANGAKPLNFKIPIVYDVGPLKLGVVPYWTDGQGAGWFFETQSTGAVGNINLFEGDRFQTRRIVEATAVTTLGSATGLGVYLWHPMGFVAYSPYFGMENVGGSNAITVNGIDGLTESPRVAHYVRAAITPSFGGIDLAVGFQGNFGAYGTKALGDTRVNYMGVDAQVMGTFGIPMMLVVNYGWGNNTSNLQGTSIAGVKASALVALIDFTLVEDILTVGGGVRFANSTYVDAAGKANGISGLGNAKDSENVIADNGVIAEVKLNLARNIRLSVTGTMDLGTPDVATSTGFTTTTTTTKENKLVVMLFGGW